MTWRLLGTSLSGNTVVVMNYWQRVLPGRVIDVVYEDLVRDPEPQIRRLLAACGLPWDPPLLEASTKIPGRC